MAPLNLPVTFGAIIAGAVIIDYGLKAAQSAFAQAASSTSTPAVAGATGPVTLNGSGYTNPVPGATLSRTDEGVDYTLGPQGFLAPGNSKVITTSGGWFRGGSIVLELLDGPYKGAQYFVAEGVKPAAGITAGATVQAGQRVADPIASPYNGIVGNIEAGWWKGGVPLAQSTGGYTEGAVTAAGAAWDDFVRVLQGVAHASNAIQRGSVQGLPIGAY